MPSPIFQITAHRGLPGRWPENTLLSFDHACKHQPDWLELDFHATADGQLVCLHDAKLDRHLQPAHEHLRGRLIGEIALSELTDVDMGSWKDASFAHVRLCTLAQVFERYLKDDASKEAWQPRFMIEHKSGTAVQLMAVLRDHPPRPGSVLVQSFDWQFLANLRQLDATIPLGLLGSRRDARMMHAPVIQEAKAIGATFVNWDTTLTSADVTALHVNDLLAGVYTLNTPAQWQQAWADGVDIITTDRCDAMRTWRESLI